MPKPKSFPERHEIRLPIGTIARIDRIVGGDRSAVRPGQDIRGKALRRWVLDRLAQEEARSRPVAEPAETPPTEDDSLAGWIARAATLLSDPDPEVRRRFIERMKLTEDYRETRRRRR